MSNPFLTHLQKSANKTTTSKGAGAYKSTTNKNLDFFSSAGSVAYPNLVSDFETAFLENSETALRNLLHMRDIRGDTGGYGIRENFKTLLLWLADNKPQVFKNTRLIQTVPVVGRWDDLFPLVVDHTASQAKQKISAAVIAYIGAELKKEVPDGLLCKWLPKTGIVASKLRSYLKLTPKQYRQILVKNRNVVETKMCNKQWSQIVYQHVPSKANKLYRNAFKRHDSSRYETFLDAALTGETTIKASTLYPHEIVGSLHSSVDKTKEALWKNQKDYLPEGKSILPLIDVSGSMTCSSYSNYTCMDVAVSLGLYLAERCKGVYKNSFITFSTKPEFKTLRSSSLSSAIHAITNSNWSGSTNIEAAFDLILTSAVKVKAKAEDLPDVFLVLSDMEFDQAHCSSKPIFKVIKKKFKEAGYKLPLLVFWNLNSRYSSKPVVSSQENTVLVSGYSPAILQSILSVDQIEELTTITPEVLMHKALSSSRYDIF